MVRMGSPVRFRRGVHHNQQHRPGTSRSVLCLEGRQLPFARDLPVRSAHCESGRAGSWGQVTGTDQDGRVRLLELHHPGRLSTGQVGCRRDPRFCDSDLEADAIMLIILAVQRAVRELNRDACRPAVQDAAS